MKYLHTRIGKGNFIFFTAEDGQDFSMRKEGFGQEIDNIKAEFSLKDVGYVKQIHSDFVHIFSESGIEGDGLITDRADVGIGVFNADCVPVLIYDNRKNVAAAVHSGWKGTYAKITAKAIDMLINNYESDPEDIFVVIGPHIKGCCYEVGQDLIDKFKQDELYTNKNISQGRNLDLQKCIVLQCRDRGVQEANITLNQLCTCCSDTQLHSFRRDGEQSGRLFSLIFMKD